MMESRNRQMSSLTMIMRKCGCIVSWQDIDSEDFPFHAWIACSWIGKARREDGHWKYSSANDSRLRGTLLLSSAESVLVGEST
jgi:hypothetical protein